jgi:hypothetical protein
MQAVRYQGTPVMITALASEKLEVASLAYSTLGLGLERSAHHR